MSNVNWSIRTWSGFTYGNYGGVNWTGGERYGTDVSVRPVDALDEIFRQHDISYQIDTFSARYQANQKLVDDI